MSVRVKIDARETLKGLNGIAKQQFPFAYASALSEVAKLAQIAVRHQTKERFKLHGDYIPRGVMVQAAKKKDVQSGFAHSAVFTSDGITSFMAWHETGGTKKPAGRALTIPGEGLKKYRYKTSRGATATRWKPKVLLEGYAGSHAAKPKGTGKGGRGKPFIESARGSEPAKIVRRVSRKAYPLEVLYIFRPQARIKARWGFEDRVRTVVDQTFVRVFEQKWSQAIAEAK